MVAQIRRNRLLAASDNLVTTPGQSPSGCPLQEPAVDGIGLALDRSGGDFTGRGVFKSASLEVANIPNGLKLANSVIIVHGIIPGLLIRLGLAPSGASSLSPIKKMGGRRIAAHNSQKYSHGIFPLKEHASRPD